MEESVTRNKVKEMGGNRFEGSPHGQRCHPALSEVGLVSKNSYPGAKVLNE